VKLGRVREEVVVVVIQGLFYDAISSLDSAVLNGRMINE
jgi:hypothetical protein